MSLTHSPSREAGLPAQSPRPCPIIPEAPPSPLTLVSLYQTVPLISGLSPVAGSIGHQLVTMDSFEEVGPGAGGKAGPSGSSPERPRSWACTPLASRAGQREEPGLRNWKPHSWITHSLLGTLGKMWSLGLFICKMGRSFRNRHLKVFMWPTNTLLFRSCFVPHPQSSLKNQNGSNKKSNCPDVSLKREKLAPLTSFPAGQRRLE